MWRGRKQADLPLRSYRSLCSLGVTGGNTFRTPQFTAHLQTNPALDCASVGSLFIQRRGYAKKDKKGGKKKVGMIDTGVARKMLEEQQRVKEREEEKKLMTEHKAKLLKKWKDKDKKKKKKKRIVIEGKGTELKPSKGEEKQSQKMQGKNEEQTVVSAPAVEEKVSQKTSEDVEKPKKEDMSSENTEEIEAEDSEGGEKKKVKKKKKSSDTSDTKQRRKRFRDPEWPTVVYSDQSSAIIDFPGLRFSGKDLTGKYHVIEDGEWIPLPEGSVPWVLEDRAVLGYDIQDRKFYAISTDPRYSYKENKRGGYMPWAVAAVLPPAYVMLYTQAYECYVDDDEAPLQMLPPAAIGWFKDQFVTAAMRVDEDKRQDWEHFDSEVIERRIELKIKEMPENRLVRWLARCAYEKECRTASNFFMGRWEAPLPVAKQCNAKCFGCPNSQESSSPFSAPLERLDYTPSVEELVQIAVGHLKTAPDAIVSFGQSCEGEPLLQTNLIAEAIRKIRKLTTRGTIHMNTNGSLPNCVTTLRKAGLDSLRVSVNSVRPRFYTAYYRPDNPDAAFESVKQSIKNMKDLDGFVSLDYLMMPGFTDQVQEFEYLCEFLQETKVDMIQWRTLALDPHYYAKSIDWINKGPKDPKLKEAMGIKNFMEKVKEAFPHLRYGHYNPCLDPSASKYNFTEDNPSVKSIIQ